MSRSSDARRPGRAPQAPASVPPASDGQSNGQAVALFRAAQFGDRAAFGEIVRMYQDRLFNTLLRLLGNSDDAAEMCQETFTRVFEKLADFRGDAGPYTWMFRIATNLALTELRKRQTRRTFTIGDDAGSLDAHATNGRSHQAAALVQRMESAAPSPARQAEQRELHERVVAALGRMDPEQRFLVVMRDVEGFDYQEMAEVLGVPLGTLKSRLFRARLGLREALKGVLGPDAFSEKR